MPMYNYKCTTCETVFDAFKKMSERNECSDLVCPECNAKGSSEYVMSAPMIVSDVGSLLSKTDNGWKEVLSKVKEKHVINNIKT